MLATVTGRLEAIDLRAGLILLALGPPEWGFALECHAPLSTIQPLAESAHGSTVTLHTHLEFAPQGGVVGALRPKLYGFLHPLDKQFFLKLITVKGVGASVALDMMARPTASIAAAIETKDEKFLKSLPRIGASKAKLLIAELSEKVGAFKPEGSVLVATAEGPSAPTGIGGIVYHILRTQLALDDAEAAELVGDARARWPECDDVETLLQAVFDLRSAR